MQTWNSREFHARLLPLQQENRPLYFKKNIQKVCFSVAFYFSSNFELEHIQYLLFPLVQFDHLNVVQRLTMCWLRELFE